MKKHSYIFLLISFFLFSGQVNAVVIWGTETFPDANGTKDDPSGEWITNSSACNLFDGGLFEVQNNKIEGEDLDGKAVWKTQSIDISAYPEVQFSLELDDNGGSLTADDTVWVYYTVDGGSEILLYKGIDDLPSSPENISAINITGSSLVIIVKMFNNQIGEKYTIDNVLVEDFTPTTYYSRASGDWDVAANWSTDDVLQHTGAAAASFPDADDVFVVIGNGNTINVVADREMADLTVTGGGTLLWTVNNRILDIVNNGKVEVQAGSSISDGTTSGSRFRFPSNGFYEIISNGALFEIGRINVNLEESQLTFSGSTDITLYEHFNYNNPGTEIINNNTGTLTVPLVRFKDPNQKFTNNGTLVTNEFQRQTGNTDGCIITNKAGATMTVNTEMDCGDNIWEVRNYGTFDHNGSWTNVTAGEVSFYNYAGATYNYSGPTTSDPDLYVYADYANNTFNYDRAGDQNIYIPQDAYSDLTLSNSGIKTPAAGTLDVNNDLTISETAVLAVNTNSNDITLAGNWNNSTGIAGTFTEGTQTVTLDGTGTQEITNTADEIFYNLTVNKTAGSVTFEAGSDVEVTNQLTITNGIVETGTRSLYGAGNIVASGGDVRFTKTGVTVPEMTGTINCTGGIFSFNGAGAQSIKGTPGAEEYHALLFDGSGTKTLAGTIDVDSILTIDAGVVLDVSATPYNISVEGNWNNLGDFTEQTGTVTFDGSKAITISHSSEETFYNLTINNTVASNAITLNSDVRVSNLVTFTDGHVVSNNANTFKMSAGATTASVSNASHVKGIMEKDMNSNSLFEFPIGDGLTYRRGGITPAGTGATTYRMEYFQSKHPVADPTVLDHISAFEHWTLERVAGTENCAVRLSYNTSSIVDEQASLLIVNYDGASDWTDECSGCSTGGAVSDGWIETGGNFTFGTSKYFTLGCDDNTKNPLVGNLYSRGSSTWSDNTNWSYLDGGASCGCTPQSTTKIFVRDGETVQIDVSASANSVKVFDGGTLQWTSGDDLQLSKNGIIDVESGGTFTRNGNTGAVQFMTEGAEYTIINEGNIDIYNLNLFNTGGTVTFSGSSDITIADNIEVETADISITNDNTGTINLDNSSTTGDLIFKSSGQSLTNNGTITLGRNLSFEDDNSSVTNNNIFTISGDVSIAGTTDDNNVVTNAAAGTLTLTGNADLNSSIFTIYNNGILDMDGEFQNVVAGKGNFYNYAGSTWNFAGGTTSDADAYLYCNYSINTFNYDGAVDQNIYVPRDAYNQLTLSTSGTKTSTGNIDINGNLVISGTAVLDVDTGDDNINLAGNWTNTSGAGDPFVQGTETVTFDGSTQTLITNSNGETFYNVVVNKTSDSIVLNTSVSTSMTIATGGLLTMTKGNIQTTSSELLIISDNSGLIGGNATSFVDGPLRKLGDDDFTFNVGENGIWAPVIIEGNTEGETFTVQYSSTGYSDTSVTGALTNVSTVEYWDIIDGGLVGGNDADITLQWSTKERSGIDDAADLVIAHYNGADWEDLGQSAIDFSDPGWIKTTGVSSFSPFAPGSKADDVNPLPVELLSFTAESNGEQVDINWSTAAEINNDYFIVEKSQFGNHFEEVTIVNGAGQSTTPQQYTSLDEQPYAGQSFYRLKQVDFNKNFEYSNVVAVEHHKELDVTIFPNPLKDGPLYLSINGGNSQELLVILYNALGIEVYSKVIVQQNDSFLTSIDIGNRLPPGVYIIVGSSKNELFRKRIVIQ